MPPRCDGRATRARKSAASSSPSRPKDTHQRDVRRVESGETLKNTSARRRDDGGMRRRGRRARTRGRLRRARRSDCAGERPTRRPPAAATADRRRLFAGQIHFSTTRARDADRGKRGVATRATRATTRRRRGLAWTYGSSRKSAWRLLLSSQVSSYAPVDEGDGSARWPCFNPVLQSGRRWRARRASAFLIDYSVVSRMILKAASVATRSHPLQRLDHEQPQAVVDHLLERLAQVHPRVRCGDAVPTRLQLRVRRQDPHALRAVVPRQL